MTGSSEEVNFQDTGGGGSREEVNFWNTGGGGSRGEKKPWIFLFSLDIYDLFVRNVRSNN